VSAAAPSPEDQARANFYALLARLFYAAPDRDLLAALAAADEIVAQSEDATLPLAWRDLTLAAAALDEEAAKREYFAAFVGTGKAEISPYASAHLRDGAGAIYLVELRGFLAAHGLARRESVHEPEDHIAALCDVMRHLIAEQHRARFELQREFFARFVWPASQGFCDATIAAERTAFYKSVARLAKSLFELEHAAFDMH
jgi:TorA maturation chaperone TorD